MQVKIVIPDKVSLFFCRSRQKIIIKGPANSLVCSLSNNYKVRRSNYNEVVIFPESKALSKKKVLSYLNTMTSVLKRLIKDSFVKSCVRLRLVGVGYKARIFLQDSSEYLELKLGFSHKLYVKIPDNVDVKIHKSNKIFIFGNSYVVTTQLAAMLKSLKMPEPYKGKGILMHNEVIKKKIGKKI